MISNVAAPFYIHTSNVQGFKFLQTPANTFSIFRATIVDVKWYLVVLIYITNE